MGRDRVFVILDPRPRSSKEHGGNARAERLGRHHPAQAICIQENVVLPECLRRDNPSNELAAVRDTPSFEEILNIWRSRPARPTEGGEGLRLKDAGHGAKELGRSHLSFSVDADQPSARATFGLKLGKLQARQAGGRASPSSTADLSGIDRGARAWTRERQTVPERWEARQFELCRRPSDTAWPERFRPRRHEQRARVDDKQANIPFD